MSLRSPATGELREVKAEMIGEQHRDGVADGGDGRAAKELEGVRLGQMGGIGVSCHLLQLLVAREARVAKQGFRPFGIGLGAIAAAGTEHRRPLAMRQRTTQQTLAELGTNREMAEDPDRRVTMAGGRLVKRVVGQIIGDPRELSKLKLIDRDFVVKHGSSRFTA